MQTCWMAALWRPCKWALQLNFPPVHSRQRQLVDGGESPKLFSGQRQLIDEETCSDWAQVGSAPANQAQLSCISQHVSKVLTLSPPIPKRCVRLSIAAESNSQYHKAHGVYSSAHWVTRTPWHNTHFNCLLLFIYRKCFIDIITGHWWSNESEIIHSAASLLLHGTGSAQDNFSAWHPNVTSVVSQYSLMLLFRVWIHQRRLLFRIVTGYL